MFEFRSKLKSSGGLVQAASPPSDDFSFCLHHRNPEEATMSDIFLMLKHVHQTQGVILRQLRGLREKSRSSPEDIWKANTNAFVQYRNEYLTKHLWFFLFATIKNLFPLFLLSQPIASSSTSNAKGILWEQASQCVRLFELQGDPEQRTRSSTSTQFFTVLATKFLRTQLSMETIPGNVLRHFMMKGTKWFSSLYDPIKISLTLIFVQTY